MRRTVCGDHDTAAVSAASAEPAPGGGRAPARSDHEAGAEDARADHHRGRRDPRRRGGQREGAGPLRRRAGPGGPPIRDAGRRRPRDVQLAAEPSVDVHRARHRRRQRVRGARRRHPHHPRRARPAQQRSGAGRRARPRDRRTSTRSTPSRRSRRARWWSSARTPSLRSATRRCSTGSSRRPPRW